MQNLLMHAMKKIDIISLLATEKNCNNKTDKK